MDLARRITLQLCAALAIPAAGAAWTSTHLFPDDSVHRASMAIIAPAALAVLALAGLGFWSMLGPVRAGLAPGAPEPVRRAASASALRAPGRLAALVLLAALAAVAAVVTQRIAAGRPLDVALAAGSAAVAFALMAAMLAYSVASAGLSPAIARLGSPEAAHPGSMGVRVLLVGAGLLAVALLLLGPLAYARYRTDMDRDAVLHAEQVLQAAARVLPERGPAAAVELAHLATGMPVALLDAKGSVLARAGRREVPPARSGAPVETLPDGWRLRLLAPGGNQLVAFVPDAQLLPRRRAFFATNAALGLGVLAAASVLVWLVARSFTVPLRYLGSAADRVASGDLTAEPPSLTRDELGQLAADFRRMIGRLAALVQGVQEASRGVLDGARAMEEIGGRVRAGAEEEREQVVGVQGAVEAMQEAVALAGRGVEGLSEYVASTSAAVAQMTAALEEVRRQAAELERLAESSGQDVGRLSETGRRAQEQLGALETLAGHAGGSLSAVSGTLASLENTAVASQLAAAQAAELAEHAGGVVREAAEGIEGVRAAVADAKRRVTVLGRRSDDIDQILTFIGEVAGRTNLLSLNASIIATQAGEHGKGFAVVAEQIRDLASQISRSTQSIGEIIRAVRDDVEGTAQLIDRGDDMAASGVALARKSLGALEEIRSATAKGHETAAAIQGALQAHGESTREVAELVASVAESSQALAEAVQMIGRSVAGVGSVTGGVNGLADRVSRALEEQSGLGRRQLEALERINGMIGEIARAMDRHAAASRRVQEALQRLNGTSRQHEAAVGALGGVAAGLGRHSRALAERVGRFKI
jgi:methyl-accepting chemotaxis protein